MTVLDTVAAVLRDAQWELEFTMLEIGAREIHKDPEPFYRLLELFPGSRVIAFEPDEAFCKTQNAAARPSLKIRVYPALRGRSYFLSTWQAVRTLSDGIKPREHICIHWQTGLKLLC